MCGPFENEACGWPKNTIRAIIAVNIVLLSFGATVSALIYLLVRNDTNDTAIALGLQSAIWAVLGSIVTFYFTTKMNDSATDKLRCANEALLADKDGQIQSMRQVQRDLILSRQQVRGGFVRRRRVPIVPTPPNPVFQSERDNATNVLVQPEVRLTMSE